MNQESSSFFQNTVCETMARSFSIFLPACRSLPIISILPDYPSIISLSNSLLQFIYHFQQNLRRTIIHSIWRFLADTKSRVTQPFLPHYIFLLQLTLDLDFCRLLYVFSTGSRCFSSSNFKFDKKNDSALTNCLNYKTKMSRRLKKWHHHELASVQSMHWRQL